MASEKPDRQDSQSPPTGAGSGRRPSLPSDNSPRLSSSSLSSTESANVDLDGAGARPTHGGDGGDHGASNDGAADGNYANNDDGGNEGSRARPADARAGSNRYSSQRAGATYNNRGPVRANFSTSTTVYRAGPTYGGYQPRTLSVHERHQQGTCLPCVNYFLKPSCPYGDRCTFCHVEAHRNTPEVERAALRLQNRMPRQDRDRDRDVPELPYASTDETAEGSAAGSAATETGKSAFRDKAGRGSAGRTDHHDSRGHAGAGGGPIQPLHAQPSPEPAPAKRSSTSQEAGAEPAAQPAPSTAEPAALVPSLSPPATVDVAVEPTPAPTAVPAVVALKPVFAPSSFPPQGPAAAAMPPAQPASSAAAYRARAPLLVPVALAVHELVISATSIEAAATAEPGFDAAAAGAAGTDPSVTGESPPVEPASPTLSSEASQPTAAGGYLQPSTTMSGAPPGQPNAARRYSSSSQQRQIQYQAGQGPPPAHAYKTPAGRPASLANPYVAAAPANSNGVRPMPAPFVPMSGYYGQGQSVGPPPAHPVGYMAMQPRLGHPAPGYISGPGMPIAYPARGRMVVDVRFLSLAVPPTGTLVHAMRPDQRTPCDRCTQLANANLLPGNRVQPTAFVLSPCRHFICESCMATSNREHCPINQCLKALDQRTLYKVGLIA